MTETILNLMYIAIITFCLTAAIFLAYMTYLLAKERNR